MNVLLDVCAMLALSRGELPGRASAALRSAPEAIVSSVTPWEMAIKAARGKLTLQTPPLQTLTILTSDENIAKYPGIATLW